MNKIDNTGTEIAALGRNEDSMLAHVAPGEMVVPPVISPQTQMLLQQEMMSAGLDPNEYTVGQGMSINPITGLAEFSFLKKLGKSLKKVVKKIAPIAVSFIPGIGPVAKGALTAVAGKASGLSTKEALLGGLTAGVGAKIAAGRAAAAGTAGAAGKGLSGLKGTSGRFFGQDGTFRNILSAGKEYVLPGEDKKGLFKNIFGGRDSLQPYSDAEIDEMLTTMDPSVVEQIVAERNAEISEPRFKGLVGPDSFADKILNIDPNKGTGPLSFLQGSGGQQLYDADGKAVSSGGFGLGGAGGIAGLAALYGLATKKAAEKTEGGLRDIRLSTRPDLMPQQVFQGFDVGVRPGMKEGTTVFNINERDPKNEAFAFRILQSNNPSITIQGLDEIDKQKFEHGLIMGGEFGVFSDIVRGTDYTPSSKFQDIMRAHAKGIADINRGMAYGGRMDEQELDMRMGGPSVGPGTETSDDIPAMLSDGEFVHTAKANKGLGGFKIEKNKDSITLYPTGKPDREQGFKNNDMMMKMFEDYQEMVS